jgi:hypothetical protein
MKWTTLGLKYAREFARAFRKYGIRSSTRWTQRPLHYTGFGGLGQAASAKLNHLPTPLAIAETKLLLTVVGSYQRARQLYTPSR